MGWLLGAIVCLGGVITFFTSQKENEWAMGFIFLLMFGYCVVKFKNRSKKESERQRKNKEKRIEKRKAEFLKEKVFNEVLHMGGLNVPVNCQGMMKLKDRKLTMLFGSSEISLDIDKITDVHYSEDVDIKTYHKSSLMKGMVGGNLFGLPGAIVGSMPKTKEKKYATGQLLIAYQTNGEERQIALRDTKANVFGACMQLNYDLKERISIKQKKIEL